MAVDPIRLSAAVEHDGVSDRVAIEEPLEIRVRGAALAVTMRTPGHDEELASGFLYGEGLMTSGAGRARPPTSGQHGRGRRRSAFDAGRRRFYTTSSCGVCGKGALRRSRCTRAARPTDRDRRARCSPTCPTACVSPRSRPPGPARHRPVRPPGRAAAGREDVGRHNAMDKVVGRALLTGCCRSTTALLCVSGRLSFELVQKAAVAGARSSSASAPRPRWRWSSPRPRDDAVRVRTRRAAQRLHRRRSGGRAVNPPQRMRRPISAVS